MCKYRLSIVFFISIMSLFVLSSCGHVYENELAIIRIGVSEYNEEWFRLSTLQHDLESRFNISIEFIDLSYGTYSLDEYMYNIYSFVKNGYVDMVLGVPSNFAIPLINSGTLLDITDYIDNMEYLHRGIVDKNKRIGNGRLFTISPVITNIQLLFTNQVLLDSFNLESGLSDYMSWDNLVAHLNNLEEYISKNDLPYRTLAFEVASQEEQNTRVARRFIMSLIGSENPFDENGLLTNASQNFFRQFSEIVSKHGMTSEEVLYYGGYPWDFAFANGGFVHMLGELSELERLMNYEFNNYHNSISPWSLIVDFPIAVSVISVNGYYSQNLRETAIFINRYTEHKYICINIVNLLLSEEYAKKMINSRFEYSHFSTTYIAIPTFFNESTITLINEVYRGNFDISLIYSGRYAGAIDSIGTFMFVNRRYLELFERAFTQVYWRGQEIELSDSIEVALEFISSDLQLQR